MNFSTRLLALAFLFLSLLSGCGNRGLISSRLQDGPSNIPTRILVAPADFVINEIGFGREQERVVAWESQASKVFENTVLEMSDKEGSFKVVDYKTLTLADQELIGQHRALFATMTSQLLQIKEGKVGVWQKQKDNFHYTLGEGMRELAERENIQAVVFVVGKDTVRSTARIMVDMLNAIIPGADSLSASNAYLLVGLANMKTGDILSFDTDVAARKTLSDAGDLKEMANNALTDYKQLLRKTGKVQK